MESEQSSIVPPPKWRVSSSSTEITSDLEVCMANENLPCERLGFRELLPPTGCLLGDRALWLPLKPREQRESLANVVL